VGIPTAIFLVRKRIKRCYLPASKIMINETSLLLSHSSLRA
jgi:hypothetical protein